MPDDNASHRQQMVEALENPRDNARYLNTLSDEHWRRWYESERRWNEALDRHIAAGLSVTEAADAAAKELLDEP